MEHYDTYKTRRVRLNPAVEQDDSELRVHATAPKDGQARAEARLYALREMMLMEIPDRWSDVLLDDSRRLRPPMRDRLFDRCYLSERTHRACRTSICGDIQQLVGRTNDLTGAAEHGRRNPAQPRRRVPVHGHHDWPRGDGEARTLFGENSIGDTDGDGAPEFLDGWGHPINFLRWAPGFDSQIQIECQQRCSTTVDDRWSDRGRQDHDPFDVFRVDPHGVSAGAADLLGRAR